MYSCISPTHCGDTAWLKKHICCKRLQRMLLKKFATNARIKDECEFKFR